MKVIGDRMLIGNYNVGHVRLREIIDAHTVIDAARPKDIVCIYGDRSHCTRNCVCYSETEPVLIGPHTIVLWTCGRCGVTRYAMLNGDPTDMLKANGGMNHENF